MSETGSHARQAFSPTGDRGTTASQFPSGTPSHGPSSVVTDDRTVISTKPPTPVIGAGVLAPDGGRSLLGERLDHFELQELVGGGGMGVVFKALDTRLNRIVALKVLARDQADEEEKVRRFQNEAQSAARLDHDHIARVYFVGQDRGLHYIVFEYIEGVNLRDLVARKGPLPLEETVSFTLQIAEALAHASSRDVVHRDIKPSNVLITSQGRAKLVDMGLARLHQVERCDNDLTSSGVTLGTFDYISPEQARDPRGADVRSDIYSLGCTAYYMLTARPPFPEGNVLQKLLQHNNDPPPDPAEFNPDLPEQVSKLIRKMLAKDPRRRQQTAGELVADLLVLIDQLGLPTGNVDPLAWTVATGPRITSIERHLPWLVPLVILVIAVAAMEAFWRSDVSPHPAPAPRTNAAQTSPPLKPSVPQAAPPEANARPPQPVDQPTVATVPPNENVASIVEKSQAPATSAAPENAAGVAIERPAAVAPARSSAALPKESAVGSPSIADKPTAVEPMPPRTETASTQTASNPVTVEPPMKPAVAAPSAPRLGVRHVDPSRTGVNVHASLREACMAATSNDVIELHYNGRLEEKPFRVSNKTLTIRAGEGFSPVIAFRHRELPASEPQAMLTLVGGQLAIVGVAIEFDVPTRYDPPSWALIQTQRANSVRLDRCWLTIRNATEQRTAQHPFVAFFDIKAPPDTGAMAMEHAAMPEHTVNLQIQNSVVRGEASLVRCDELQPVSLTWSNGLLATSERLLVARGGEMANRANGQISIALQHITAHVRSGLCLISNAEGRPLLRTSVQCSDSILLAGAEAPLFEQTGVNSVEDFESKMEWIGNRYFYSGFNTFWKIASFTHDPVRRTFDDWQRHWKESVEKQETWSGVVFKQIPDAARPLHTHTPADYELDESSPDNQAYLIGATDGASAGLLPGDLPPPPEAVSMPLPMALTPRLSEEMPD